LHKHNTLAVILSKSPEFKKLTQQIDLFKFVVCRIKPIAD
jgi:hypothetical protein